MRHSWLLRRSLVPLLAALGLVAFPAGAGAAGRLVETGHDADYHCAAEGNQCHFIQAVVNYVRNGAPDPSKKVLVLDRNNLQLQHAIERAFPPSGVPMDVMAPQSTEFANANLSTSVYSAILVASDQTCGLFEDSGGVHHTRSDTDPALWCDLNPATTFPPTFGTATPQDDSAAILNRVGAIKTFFDSGGGLFVGAGADNADGHPNDLYYQFVQGTGGAPVCQLADCTGGTGGAALTNEGRTIGFTDGANGTPDDINCGAGTGCDSHNSFLPPGAGSLLLIAEGFGGGSGSNALTLFEDTNPPDTVVTGGPGPALHSAIPLPEPALSAGSAAFTFRASEDTTSFRCQLDGGALSPCGSPASFSGLGQGQHTFGVVATDAGHNSDPTPGTSKWFITQDRDGDGYFKFNPFGDPDCGDNNPRQHPNAAEILGNRVDENCDGSLTALSRIGSLPAYDYDRCGAGCLVFTRLVVSELPKGSVVRLSCKPKRCRISKKLRPVKRDQASVNLLRYLKKRHFHRRWVLTIKITRSNFIGRVRQLKVLKASAGNVRARAFDYCTYPGTKKLRKTCGSIH